MDLYEGWANIEHDHLCSHDLCAVNNVCSIINSEPGIDYRQGKDPEN